MVLRYHLLAFAVCALLLPAGAAPMLPDKLADRYTLRLWGREQDFPDTKIHALDIDDDGHLWFATSRNLTRFDGVNLNLVTNLPTGMTTVRGWLNDGAGTPWMYGAAGLARLTSKGWRYVAAVPACPLDVQAVFTNTVGGLWVVGGRYLWHCQGGQLTRVAWPAELTEPPQITSATLDAGQTLWVVTGGRLRAFQGGRWLTDQEAGVRPWSAVTLVHAEEHGTLMVAAGDGLHVRRQGRWTLIPLPAPATAQDVVDMHPTALLEEPRNGNLWMGTRHALYRCTHGTWQALTASDIGAQLSVNVLQQDRYSDIWVGLESGLLCLHRRSVTMLHTTEAARPEPISTVVALNTTQVWVGVTGRGLWAVSNGKLDALSLPLPNNTTVSALLPAAGGGWWVGTKGDGLCWMTTNRLVRANVVTGGHALPQNVTALCRDRSGRVWVGAWEGLFRFPDMAPQGEYMPPLQRVALPAQDTAAERTEQVVALAEDAGGALWVAPEGQGLVRVETNGQVRSFGRAEGLPDAAVLCLHVDSEGRLWGGCTHGLIRWDGQGWRICDFRNDLLVRQLHYDGNGRLWMGTPRGLQCLRSDALKDLLALRTVSGRYFRIGVADGMTATECAPDANGSIAAVGGHLYFATLDGVVSVPMGIAQTGRKPLVVNIEQATAGGQTFWDCRGRAPGEPLPPVRHCELPPGSQPVSFEFAMPDLFWSERIRYDYQWKLEGLSQDWSLPTAEPRVTFDYLPPGDYSLRVRGRRESDWREAALPVNFRVRPFFWQELWFRGAVAALALGLTALTAWQAKRGWYRRRLRRAEQAQVLAQERTRIAQDLHDDMGAGLTEISLLGDLAATEAHGATRDENIGLLTQRARSLVTKLDEIVWAVNPRHDHLESLSDFFCNYAQHFLRTAGIACVLDIATTLPDLPLEARVRHQLFLAFKEALNNLVRHSGATQAQLRIAIEQGELRIGVDDNGRGLSPAAGPGVHDGLRSMCSRLEKLGGTCDIQSPTGGGVTVLLRLPLPAGRSV